MTSQRQFTNGCEGGILLDANIFCEILVLRRVYELHTAAIHNLMSGCALNKIGLGFLCCSTLNGL